MAGELLGGENESSIGGPVRGGLDRVLVPVDHELSGDLDGFIFTVVKVHSSAEPAPNRLAGPSQGDFFPARNQFDHVLVRLVFAPIPRNVFFQIEALAPANEGRGAVDECQRGKPP